MNTNKRSNAIKRLLLGFTTGLGHQVEVRAIEDGVHDLILSKPEAREKVFQELLTWLVRVGGGQ